MKSIITTSFISPSTKSSARYAMGKSLKFSNGSRNICTKSKIAASIPDDSGWELESLVS